LIGFSIASVGEETNQHPSNPSFRCLDPGGPNEQRKLQPVDFKQAAASDALQVAVQASRRFDDAIPAGGGTSTALSLGLLSLVMLGLTVPAHL